MNGTRERGSSVRRRNGKRVGRRDATRAQSGVVGVALLVGLTVISLGLLTAAIGTVVESHTAAVEADRVADDLADVVEPTAATGRRTHAVAVPTGELRTVDRTLRIHDGDDWTTHAVNGFEYETGSDRVLAVAGAVIREYGDGADMRRPPSILVSDGVASVGVPVLAFGQHRAISGSAPTTATVVLRTDHERRDLGEGTFRIAVETDVPSAWERYFERLGADVDREHFAPDDHASVVATVEGNRTGYLVRHETELEIRHG